jgi:hypothetical protein
MGSKACQLFVYAHVMKSSTISHFAKTLIRHVLSEFFNSMAREPLLKGRLSTKDLLIKIVFNVKCLFNVSCLMFNV